MSSEETTKRGSKDNVFCDLFSDESYVFQLYKDLHPEDQDADARKDARKDAKKDGRREWK